ncbi:hypothetical protein AMIS_12550 [Actinoplanes missouriensis 431]|uniref:Outer membrane channel protein CpnT-like N-terminal domain-containing protein n=1 Tax=Actinoplanes missouriensis (strain ATCC 14538 / DSM 43046 / CBS 188.64 / JCM 3121 / NBRC 102363 / NCIMB 12654 / NRRL B-3342 / UNCC 431) TaxID=512565 RepID=I0H0D8_ACTM4|nr:hypothetical protein [Actinoplanes missouriensis]BAL86475.1 hypothetical protein AMIS_12550 [Actinoplanes missouriensis 431]
MSVNPLVVESQGSTTWHTGLGLVGDVADIAEGIRNNSWVDPVLGGVGAGLDLLTLAIDPLGGLMAWGVSWLMEHVRPLREALDHLAGNADQVAAHAATWSNVSAFTSGAGQDYAGHVTTDISGWSGAAADAYRDHARRHLESLDGLATATRGIAYAVEGAGLLVALVRGIVRDLIAEFVATLAVRLPQWLAVEGLTLGIASPAVASQVSALVLKWSHRIQHFIRGLLTSLRHLSAKLSDLVDAFGGLRQNGQEITRTEPFKTSAGRPSQTGGEVRPPGGNADFETRWAEVTYDAIRANDDDVPAIIQTARAHGFTPDDIIAIKNHLFREQHLLDSYDEGEMALFDANPRIAEAWQRLAGGHPHPADIDLLQHERYEAAFMSSSGDPSYRRAHAATLEAGFTWDPEAAAADGFGYQRRD